VSREACGFLLCKCRFKNASAAERRTANDEKIVDSCRNHHHLSALPQIRHQVHGATLKPQTAANALLKMHLQDLSGLPGRLNAPAIPREKRKR